MRVILIFNIFLTLSCASIDKSGDLSNNRNLIDSIHKELNINDSIQILNYHNSDSFKYYTIIDFNKNSRFHDEILKQDDNWADYQTEEYNRNNEFIYPQIKDSIKMRFPKEIHGKWYEIFRMNDEFYLFKPCDFYMIYEINDSAIVFHYMDGNYPKVLIDYKQTSDNNFDFRVAEYSFDDKNVNITTAKLIRYKSSNLYLFQYSDYCKLIVNAKDLNMFPIIYESCSDIGINPKLNFDEMKCK